MFDNRVRSFLKVVETGSYSKAAHQLYMTQPGVSRHIQSLESELGVKLFDRAGRSMIITDAGKVALEYFVRIAVEERGLLDALAPFSEKEGEFVICLGSDVINYERSIFSRMMREATEIFGGARAVQASGEREDFAKLVEGSVDIVLASTERMSRLSGQICNTPLFEARFYIACSETDPLSQKESVGIADLDGRALILADDNTQCQQWLLDDLESHPEIRPVIRREPSLSASAPLIELGKGIAFVAVKASLPDNIALVPYKAEWICTIGPCWMRRNQTSRLLAFVDRIIDAYRDPGQLWDQQAKCTW